MAESAYYESGALWHADRYASADEQHRFRVAASLIPPSARTLVDVGTGQGAFLAYLESAATDMELSGIERAREAIDAAVCQAPIAEGSVNALPIADDAVDVVTALEVLEHLPVGVYRAALAELPRVAPVVIVSVPYAEVLHQVRCPECGCRFHPNYHMRSFQPRSFASLFGGLRLDRSEVITYDDYLGGPAVRWLYRTLRGGASEMRPGHLCPQCGFRQHGTSLAREWARRSVKHRLPTRSRPRWLVGRFVKP